MATLDELLVKIDASTELLRRELGKGETSVTRFEGKVNKTLTKINKKFSMLGRGISGALAGISIGLFIRNVVQKTIAAEDAMVQLRTAVESTGGVAGFTAEQLERIAKNLQSVTTFGDEAIIAMQSILLTFTKIRGVEFERTLEAILNVSARMGTTLQGAAVQLGKALNDPIANLGELGRAGIQFSKDQKALIKSLVETGRMAEAQGIILDELDTQFGNSARAARETLGGALQGLKNAFGDLLEGSGGSLTDATAEVNKLAALLQDPQTIAAFATITSGIIKMTGALATGAAAFANFSQGVGEGIARMSGVGTPMDEAAERIEHLQSLIEKLRKASMGPGSDADLFISQYQREIESLQKLVDLNAELTRGRSAGWHPPMALPAVAETQSVAAVNTSVPSADDKRDLEAFLKMFQTAEDKVENLRATLNRFKGEISPEDFQRIGRAISESLSKGLETIEITTERLDPLIADMERFKQIIDSNRTSQEAYDRQVESTLLLKERLIAAGKDELIVNEAIGRELRRLKDDMDTLDPSIKEFTTAFAASFESRGIDALLNGDISDALKGLAKDMIELIIRLTILKPLAEGIANWFGGFGGVGLTGIDMASLPKPRAGGGPVAANTPYIVGESGRELFVPDVPGRIMNARQTAGMGGGANITINQTIQAGLPPQWAAQLQMAAQVSSASSMQEMHKQLSGRR